MDYSKKEEIVKELEVIRASLSSNVLSLRCLEDEGYGYDRSQYLDSVSSLTIVTESLSERLNEIISKI